MYTHDKLKNLMRHMEQVTELREMFNGEDKIKHDVLADFEELQSIERVAHKFAEDLCNIDMSEDTYNRRKNRIVKRLIRVIGNKTPFIVNQDPRGYALKIPIDTAKALNWHNCDWGGYGILAPDL